MSGTPIDEPSTNMTEQQYIDMANQLKETYDKISSKLFTKDLELLDLKKDLCTAYGIIRLLDDLIDNINLPHQFNTIIECLRGCLSDSMDRHIFKLEEIV